ncbi:FAD-dependent oxidoreductase [Paenarthrobacter ureafaciens]|uniref:FAD-dependent oxidoreductase n=1 Tax=Paenarthrobacter ureafaciens TaxID=37931 RepID=UPI0015B9CEF0|nr:FAD-dependent oxidoreductase [Paenarthrobacter ureafaciens]MEC3854098.1 FAD-dependent oxidoreductase [Paenarthrobacter ureafaciens]
MSPDSSEPDHAQPPAGLAELESRVASELSLLNMPYAPWVPPQGDPGSEEVLDVVVIGGGVTGLAVASSLVLRGVNRMVVLDRNPAGSEGPWATSARMKTLRTTKFGTGPTPGVPALTPRAWFEAMYGAEAWEAITYFPLDDWAAYLRWFKDVLDLPVRNNSDVVDIEPLANGWLRLTVEADGGRRLLTARRVIVCTGYGGWGGAKLPAVLQDVPKQLFAHSSEIIDFDALAGRRVGILGVGASAIDNASTALEHGAASVDFFVRRSSVPSLHRAKALINVGCIEGFGEMTAEMRTEFMRLLQADGAPPPGHSVQRLLEAGAHRVHLGADITAVDSDGDSLTIWSNGEPHSVDFLISATGFDVDGRRRPEWQQLLPGVRFVGDDPELPEQAQRAFAQHPVVDREYRLVETVPGACPAVRNVYVLADAAIPSQGIAPVNVVGAGQVAARTATAVIGSLFAEDGAAHLAQVRQYCEPEFSVDGWPAPVESVNPAAPAGGRA